MSESNFETAEVGDWFERDHGTVTQFKVAEIEETFGDRVRIVLEGRSGSTQTEGETQTIRVDEAAMNNQFAPIKMEGR